jgi:hypothetical protein
MSWQVAEGHRGPATEGALKPTDLRPQIASGGNDLVTALAWVHWQMIDRRTPEHPLHAVARMRLVWRHFRSSLWQRLGHHLPKR